MPILGTLTILKKGTRLKMAGKSNDFLYKTHSDSFSLEQLAALFLSHTTSLTFTVHCTDHPFKKNIPCHEPCSDILVKTFGFFAV